MSKYVGTVCNDLHSNGIAKFSSNDSDDIISNESEQETFLDRRQISSDEIVPPSVAQAWLGHYGHNSGWSALNA